MFCSQVFCSPRSSRFRFTSRTRTSCWTYRTSSTAFISSPGSTSPSRSWRSGSTCSHFSAGECIFLYFIFVTTAIRLTPSCFVTHRYPAEGTMGATMIYSIPGFHRPGASLCAPVGGTAAVVDKLGGCLTKFGGSMELKKHVEEIIVEDGEATGVVLKGKSPTA